MTAAQTRTTRDISRSEGRVLDFCGRLIPMQALGVHTQKPFGSRAALSRPLQWAVIGFAALRNCYEENARSEQIGFEQVSSRGLVPCETTGWP
jgi:hypothetical protein